MKKWFVLLLMCLLVISGCTSTKVQEPQNLPHKNLSDDMPGFVTEKDFDEVDWDRVATEFETDTGSDMVGNEKKVGVIGPELKPNKIEKWLWHFWGIDKGEVTLVGYHHDTKDISPVFSKGAWTSNGDASGKVNGADASLPSNVVLPKAGKWAILIYIDGKLFDTLVLDIKA